MGIICMVSIMLQRDWCITNNMDIKVHENKYVLQTNMHK